MKLHFLIAVFTALFLSACGSNVPEVDDPDNIVIDGEKLTKAQFLERFCAGKSDNETCMKILQANRKSSTRGEMPKW